MLSGFRAFILRGNVVDLAVAVVIGAAFGAVVTAFVKDLLTPMIAAIGGKPDFGTLAFTINGSRFAYGDFINAFISFLLIALVVYYLVVAPMQRFNRPRAEDVATQTCPYCLETVPAAATKCRACTSDLGAAA
ncbi:MAG: large conductance mechanosensitive channel protein MscL [Candidatus Eremiobacteraeota bacterium]|nr:large conductance mechanosensitive channel protein MscL [Candidatus Eremiobacteraeota bacterium]